MDLAQAEARYGIIDKTWKDEAKWCQMLMIPEPYSWNVQNSISRGSWTKVYINKDMADPLLIALALIKKAGLYSDIKTFDGCFNIRTVRGDPNKVSAHAYAMAIDLNADLNALGGESSWNPKIIECFKTAGFKWGGDYSRKDPMHFSLLGW
jgi:hypothetical protein